MSIALLQLDCKRAVSTLTTCSNDELYKIINDDEQIDNILIAADASCLKEIEQEKESVQTSNRTLAESNLSREPDLAEGREKLQKLSELGAELSTRIAEKSSELKSRSGDLSLETSLALLQTAASEMEEESDRIAKKYLDGDADLDDFLDQFLTKRKLMHLRLVKAEKMAKILSGGGGAGGQNYINAPPVNINTNYFPGITGHNALPYPTGPYNMPMPSESNNYFQNHF